MFKEYNKWTMMIYELIGKKEVGVGEDRPAQGRAESTLASTLTERQHNLTLETICFCRKRQAKSKRTRHKASHPAEKRP